MVHAIVVTHGNLAAELIQSAAIVFGETEGCHAVTNAQKAPETLTGELEEIVAAGGGDNRYIVFVDFFGGSCCHAGLSIEQNERVRVISGVNLPMLLAFLYKRDEVDFEKLPDELTARGHDSIRLVEAERL